MTKPETDYRCTAYTRNGTPCTCTVGLQEEPTGVRCVNHSLTGRNEKVMAGAVKGGKKTSRRRSAGDSFPEPPMPHGPESAADCMVWSAWAVMNVATGELSPNAGSRVGALLKTFLESLRIAELEDQIKTLQAQVRAAS